ncbi:MAG: 50S ribosomal protein L32 [Anaerolineae bacterium]|nr:50S ribosomal protein L32 [Anaerolineae bacterium]MDW8101059.1 50S ribosomal protein L32 [Anaerolineae bacterium]
MPPLPKRRLSPGRRDRRRAHDALKPPNLIQCPHCRKLKLPHRVCPHCGHYKGRAVITVEEE